MSENSKNIEREAAELAQKDNPSINVRKWLQECSFGTLGTISAKKDLLGFPLGSIVPFSLDSKGRPIILIAGIAAHTKNLKQDNRATLFVHDPNASGDPQASWRASLLGKFTQLCTESSDNLPNTCEVISKEEEEALMAKYVERVPNARSYLNTHNFALWRMSNIEKIRYIAGFGRITWIEGSTYLSLMQKARFKDMEHGAMVHMNEDHENNMKEICKAFYSIDPESVEMTELNIGGCLLKATNPDGLFFCSFDKVVENIGGYKAQIIKLLKKARTINAAQEDRK